MKLFAGIVAFMAVLLHVLFWGGLAYIVYHFLSRVW